MRVLPLESRGEAIQSPAERHVLRDRMPPRVPRIARVARGPGARLVPGVGGLPLLVACGDRGMSPNDYLVCSRCGLTYGTDKVRCPKRGTAKREGA
jgi:hypothetical protein